MHAGWMFYESDVKGSAGEKRGRKDRSKLKCFEHKCDEDTALQAETSKSVATREVCSVNCKDDQSTASETAILSGSEEKE